MEISQIKEQFLLNPEITYLNFGSFGACPKPVFEVYRNYQLELEREPVRFITEKGVGLLAEARKALGRYLGAPAEDLVFMTNPSYAVNTIAKSLKLCPGDEILGTNIEYGACDKTWDFIAKQTGAVYIRKDIGLPITDKQSFLENFWNGCTPRTKLIFISHITSSTGIILPVKEIIEEARRRNLLTIIDGAHVPAHIHLDLNALGADFYVGACHKWMMAPKGSAFLYASKEVQQLLSPLVVSWGYEALVPGSSLFIDHHEMNGTRDYSAFLAVPSALEFMSKHNWISVANQCRKLTIDHADRFCKLLGTEPISPLTEEYIGQMFSIPVNTEEPEKLNAVLYHKYNIEVPVHRQDDKRFIRYSVNGFNTGKDLDLLYDALEEIKNEKGSLIRS